MSHRLRLCKKYDCRHCHRKPNKDEYGNKERGHQQLTAGCGSRGPFGPGTLTFTAVRAERAQIAAEENYAAVAFRSVDSLLPPSLGRDPR